MSDQRRFVWRSGRLPSTPITDFWQISRTVQDPQIPNLPLENGGPPPDPPVSIIDGWWLVDEDDDHELGDFYASIFEALAAVEAPPASSFSLEDEDEPEAVDFGGALPAPFNFFIAGFTQEVDEEEADEAPQVQSFIEPPVSVIDPVMGWAEALDDEEGEDPWSAGFPHGAEMGPEPILGFFEVEHDEADEAIDSVFASIECADDFIQAVCEVEDDDLDDDGLFEASWNPAFDPVPSAQSRRIGQGDDPSRGIGRYRHENPSPRWSFFYEPPAVEVPKEEQAQEQPESDLRAGEIARQVAANRLASSLMHDAREAAAVEAEKTAEAARQEARNRTLAAIIAIAEADDD